MNVLQARVVLRERSLLDVVDLTVRFMARHAKSFALLGAIVLLPLILASWGIAKTGGWGWAWTAALAVAPVAAAPFTALASRLLFEPTTRIRDAAGAAGRALPSLVGLRIAEGIGLTAGGLFFVVPAAWVWSIFFYTNEVVVLERAPFGAALQRLGRLSRQGGETLAALLFLTALHIVVVFLADVVGRGVLEDLLEITAPPSIFETKGSALALLGFWGFVPFGAACRFLLYVNARTRTEGWDVQTRFTALAARAQAEAETRASMLPGGA